MITRNDLLYSAGAIMRALMGRVKGAVLRREEWWKVLFVVIALENGRKLCTFVSKKALAALFVGDRKARSRSMIVTPCLFADGSYAGSFAPGSYRVRNESKGTVYQVDRWMSKDGQRKFKCECEDFRNQQKFIKAKQHACKHIYAVLGYLGYESLADAVCREEEDVKYVPPVLPEYERHGTVLMHWSEVLREDLRPRNSWAMPAYYSA